VARRVDGRRSHQHHRRRRHVVVVVVVVGLRARALWSDATRCRNQGPSDARATTTTMATAPRDENWTTSYARETVKHARAVKTAAREAGQDASETAAGAREEDYIQFSYGTAGFRTIARTLHSTCFRSGAFAAARAMAHDAVTGIVITASHNPAADNGVKLVEPNGTTLPMDLERVAEALANGSDIDAQIEALRQASAPVGRGEEDADESEAPASEHRRRRVLVARDTRESGEALANEALAGIRAMGIDAVDCGEMTTPQLHYLVWATNAGEPCAESDYFARLSSGYAALTERGDDGDDDGDDTTCDDVTLVIDCADGVGAQKLKILGDAVAAYGLKFDLRNRGDEVTSSLNDGVGADYVQKARTPPVRGEFSSLPPNTRCVSVDGDADRLIYYETRADGSIDLFDGDKIATMIATYIKSLVDASVPFLQPGSIRVGVVQTAYANGASTAYLTQTLGEVPACVPTGVKHLHHAAEELYDVGVYFESNGHGTAIFSPKASKAIEEAVVEALMTRSMPHVEALLALTHVQRCINPAVGDAMSGILLVEAIIRRTRAKSYAHVYEDLASKQTKAKVPDRALVKTTNAERECSQPAGLQDAINAACAAARTSFNDPHVRAFVRPSGTEDCVRIYVEALTSECVDALTADVSRALDVALAQS